MRVADSTSAERSATASPDHRHEAGLPANPLWLIRLGNFLFRTRDALFPAVLVALLVLTTPSIPRGDPLIARVLDAIGLLVALAGQALRIAVIGYRYIVRGGRNRQVYAEGLVTSGFFQLSRNPLYVGNLLILGGLFIIWNSAWMYAIGVPCFLLGYRAIVAAEEAYLGQHYTSDYAHYTQHVPRWWPRLTAVAEATAGLAFNWRRVVLKEYGSAAYWMAGAAILLWLKARRYADLDGTTTPAWPYWSAVAIVASGWGGARYLKKVKKLHE
jgi:protein-S-isoprenylcysteine O-methyltransferase Ste14